jgi:hypothetical protein
LALSLYLREDQNFSYTTFRERQELRLFALGMPGNIPRRKLRKAHRYFTRWSCRDRSKWAASLFVSVRLRK